MEESYPLLPINNLNGPIGDFNFPIIDFDSPIQSHWRVLHCEGHL